LLPAVTVDVVEEVDLNDIIVAVFS
jgi:hypothetical protein